MYAIVCTRPDIAEAVSIVSRFMANPRKQHWNAIKWILWYLQGTKNKGLVYQRTEGSIICGYVDSDYAGDLDKRRTTTGYVFTFTGGLISWRSMLQGVVALSTTEAQYIAATETIKKTLWLRGLVGDLGMDQDNVEVHCDSQNAIHLAKNQVHHGQTKHIDIRFHFIREIIKSDEVILKKNGTKDNLADIMTKVAPTMLQHY